jgi:ATP-dependent DNA helicase RecG
MILNREIEYVKGIGPKRGAVLRNEVNIATVEDLIYFAPRRYLDRTHIVTIADSGFGQKTTVTGRVVSSHIEGRGKRSLHVVITDDTDTLTGVFFGGIHYFNSLFTTGDNVLFHGKIDTFKGIKQIVHPEYDFFDDDPHESVHAARIIPVYRSTEALKKAGFSSRVFRRIIHTLLENEIVHVDDPVPHDIIARHEFPSLSHSLKEIHFPTSMTNLEYARKRLAFNELFFLQYYLCLMRGYVRTKTGRGPRSGDTVLLDSLIANLPFELSNDQRKVIREIADDLAHPFPMNRLLQGDVGSGKTVVALASCLIAMSFGFQSSFMAPTEILAQQHYETFNRFAPRSVTISLLTGSTSSKERKIIAEQTNDGTINIIIGTHALIENTINFKSLGLVIIDEQHRFGVSQRSKLHQKGNSPDLLVMTATPIPRSLALTLYGDLDISMIIEMPKNRIPVKTILLDDSREHGLYSSLEKYISEGRQCYYVLPLIHESEKSDLESAINVYTKFSTSIFPHRRVNILHGKMKSNEKEDIMREFKKGNIDILVSTTVIEVGIDVPNASVMVIHHPERFGLAQLHQLRGRVGRGVHQSFCVLYYPKDLSDDSLNRLRILSSESSGFSIAEEDLKLRGSGDFLGTRQHGDSISFEFADLSMDYSLLIEARNEAISQTSGITDFGKAIEEIRARLADTRYITCSRLTKALSLIS